MPLEWGHQSGNCPSGDLGAKEKGGKEGPNAPGHHQPDPCLLLRSPGGVCSMIPTTRARQCHPGPLLCRRGHTLGSHMEHSPARPVPAAPPALPASTTTAPKCFPGDLKLLALLQANLLLFVLVERIMLAQCPRDETSPKASGLSQRDWPLTLCPLWDVTLLGEGAIGPKPRVSPPASSPTLLIHEGLKNLQHLQPSTPAAQPGSSAGEVLAVPAHSRSPSCRKLGWEVGRRQRSRHPLGLN